MNPDGRHLGTVHPSADQSPGLALWQVTNDWQRHIRDALAPFDLTHVQFVLLAHLAAADVAQPMTQHELATRCRADLTMTSQVLRRLERRGLVERRPHPHDGRARALHPTADGVELANRANAAVEAADAVYFGQLGEALGAFMGHLDTLRTSG